MSIIGKILIVVFALVGIAATVIIPSALTFGVASDINHEMLETERLENLNEREKLKDELLKTQEEIQRQAERKVEEARRELQKAKEEAKKRLSQMLEQELSSM